MLLYTESLVPVPENDNHDAGFRPITMNIFGAILGLPGVICEDKRAVQRKFPITLSIS